MVAGVRYFPFGVFGVVDRLVGKYSGEIVFTSADAIAAQAHNAGEAFSMFFGIV